MEYKYNDFMKVSISTIDYHLGDIKKTVETIKDDINTFNNSNLILFNELTLSSCSLGSLIEHKDYLDDILIGLKDIVNASKNSESIIVLGLPLYYLNKVYNVMLVIYGGHIKGGRCKENISFTTKILDEEVNIDSDKLYITDEYSFEIMYREELYTNYQFKNSDLVLVVDSLPTVIDDNIKCLIKQTAIRLHKGIVYCGASNGESTSDGAYINTLMVTDHFKNHVTTKERYLSASINLASIKFNNPFVGKNVDFVKIEQHFIKPIEVKVNKYPFRVRKPIDVINLQVSGISKRLKAINVKDVVLGFSGGLDSTLALIVLKELSKIMDVNIHCLIMPCFATSNKTMNNALNLCDELNIDYKIIDISRTTESHLLDLGHDLKTYDVTFENAQARERTQVLFDYANSVNGIVVGTGDLSEIALGFATFNGDHISNYNVNGGIPKTLIKDIINSYSEEYNYQSLKDILLTPISPELIPGENKEIVQSTETIVGPYELIDFIIYYYLIRGNSIKDIYYLAKSHFDIKDLKKYYKGFFVRFFRNQFKRNCSSDGLKIFDFGFSSRGNFKLPSDLEINDYLKFIDELEE